MSKHVFIPGISLEDVELLPEHEDWLVRWPRDSEEDIEDGNVSSSMCLQGAMSELTLHQELKTDLCGVLDEYLTEDRRPLAYSEKYGQRLYRFNFWQQTPVHAIHTRWWMRGLCTDVVTFDFADLLRRCVQASGWIYDSRNSPTTLTNRLRSELTMSMSIGVEILSHHEQLDEFGERFIATLASEPMSGYLSAGYFRIRALEDLSTIAQAPTGLDSMLEQCEAGEGYCDFDVGSKVDDYMGTAKRISRDLAVHSPVSSLHAEYVATFCVILWSRPSLDVYATLATICDAILWTYRLSE